MSRSLLCTESPSRSAAICIRVQGSGCRARLQSQGSKREKVKDTLWALLSQSLGGGASMVSGGVGNGWGLDRVSESRFQDEGAGCRVQGSGFRVQGSGFRVQVSGCKVQRSGFREQPRVLGSARAPR